LRDEDWANPDIEPYLYLKGFNGKFVLKVNANNRELAEYKHHATTHTM
jgi:hypothetical protein